MEDILQLEKTLLPEERLIQESIRRVVREELLPIMNEHFEKATFPFSIIKRLADIGAFGINIPETYGGTNASKLAYGLMCEELEAVDSAIRSFVSVQNSLVIYPIYRFGSEEQKRNYLPKLCKAELIGCFGLTEPDAGSDPSSMRTTAEKIKGGWKINGSKMWITNAPLADIAIVWAKTKEGVRGFIVEKGSPGFSAKEITGKMSLRASSTGELILDNVVVRDNQLLPGSEKGLGAALSCLTQARFGISFGAIGVAMECFNIALNYCKERKQFNKPIASFQLVQSELADMYSNLIMSRCFNFRLGKMIDEGKIEPALVSLAKRNACRVALKVARTARNLLGGNGITLDYHIIRHMLNLETVFTYEGTDHIHTLIIGKYLTGLQSFG